VGVSEYTMKPIDLYKLVESIVKAAEPYYLKRKLEETKQQHNEAMLKTILDSQDNLVFISDGNTINIANKKFLEFFNISTIDEFYSKFKSLATLFVEDKDVFYPNATTDIATCDWIEQIKHLKESEKIIKLHIPYYNNHKTFMVSIDEYALDRTKFLISLTDITSLKEKSTILEYQANHDFLTGLYNRTAFDRIFTTEIKRAKRYDTDLTLILFDIDNFKKINDTYGHDVGDEVLKDLADISQHIIREYDTIARWGGEEFIILLPETDMDGAFSVAQKIRVTLQEHKGENYPNITASFGVAQLINIDTKDTLIKKADNALYDAKKNGRNQVIRAKDEL
jgi:diguanylate cyclase (GGDEF)-like protein